MISRARTLVAASLVLSLAGTGCSSSASTSSKAGYIKKANTICVDMNRKAAALAKPSDSAAAADRLPHEGTRGHL